jgi:hypothetical protein
MAFNFKTREYIPIFWYCIFYTNMNIYCVKFKIILFKETVFPNINIKFELKPLSLYACEALDKHHVLKKIKKSILMNRNIFTFVNRPPYYNSRTFVVDSGKKISILSDDDQVL